MSAHRVAELCVELSDTRAEEFDLPAYLHMFAVRCVELLGVEVSGVIFLDGGTPVLAASAEHAIPAQAAQLPGQPIGDCIGPSAECFRRAEWVGCPDLAAVAGRWPRFVAAAEQGGFRSMHAVPMHWRGTTVGVLNLFGTRVGPLPEPAERLVTPLVHIATIALLQRRAMRSHAMRTTQLQDALDSRVAIEQAKGLLAERLDTDLVDAFRTLRGFARSHNLRLADLASNLVADRSRLAEVQRWAG